MALASAAHAQSLDPNFLSPFTAEMQERAGPDMGRLLPQSGGAGAGGGGAARGARMGLSACGALARACRCRCPELRRLCGRPAGKADDVTAVVALVARG